MHIDLNLLTNTQREKMYKLYQEFLNEVQSSPIEKRKAARISVEDLKQKLFNERDTEWDIYMDIDSSKFGSSCTFDEDTGNIINYRTKEVIQTFTFNDFVPCCDHLGEELLDELNDQVSYSTGGNYSRWADIHNEAKHNPDSLLGYHTLENGLSFYGMYGTNDCVWPVFFIVYFDGERLRGYIPHEGNEFCKGTMEAWGQECSFPSNEAEQEQLDEVLMKKIETYTYFDFKKLRLDILHNITVE